MAENDMNLINQYQLFQQQLQSVLIQREDTKLELMENEKALEQLKDNSIKEAYKISGQIMVKKDIESIKKDIEDRISELELRMSALDRTEKKISEKLSELEPKIQKMLGQ